MVRSTSVSGPIQCEVGPPASNSGFPIMRTFTSGRVFTDPRVGGLLSPAPLEFACSRCHRLNALWWGQPLVKWPGNPHTKHFHSLSLVTAHCLSQVHIETTNHFYFRLGVLPCDRISQCQPLLLQGCHPARRCWVAPVLFSIHL